MFGRATITLGIGLHSNSSYFIMYGLLFSGQYTVSQKSSNLQTLCQILTDFPNFCTARKRMKFHTLPSSANILEIG